MEIPYSPKNEAFLNRFIKKSDEFTDSLHDKRIRWVTEKVKQLFKFKSKNSYPPCVIYKGTCVCNETYIVESRRNARIK